MKKLRTKVTFAENGKVFLSLSAYTAGVVIPANDERVTINGASYSVVSRWFLYTGNCTMWDCEVLINLEFAGE